MRRTIGRSHRQIILRTRVAISHQDRDRCAERFSFKHAGENLATIFLLALRGDLALAGTPPIELALNVGFADLDLRRATIDHNADAAAVRFAEGGNAKKLAKGITHFERMLNHSSAICRAFL